jgi:hypothetical protein
MRIKTLLCLAALTAVGVTASMAQSNVYSLNVVGYVNVVYPGNANFSMACNPLNNANNDITNLFKAPPDGTSIIRWDAGIQDLSSDQYSYSTFLGQWLKNGSPGDFVLNPGEGVFLITPSDPTPVTNTFTGDVVQGPYNIGLLGSANFNAVGSTVPLGGNFTNSIAQLPQVDGDTVQQWDVNIQDLAGAAPNWSQFLNQWVPNTNNIVAGEGFFYIRQDPAITWTRNYSVPQTP